MARELRIEIVGDDKSLQRALGNAGKGSETLGKKLSKMGKLAALSAGGAGLAAVGIEAKRVITAASNLNESTNAVQQVFGKASGQVLKFSKSASNLGLSMRAANELVTPIGASLRNAGFGADAAAKASITLTKRAADMASVFNTSVPEALEAVQAGLRGEADPLERFGVGLSDQAVKAQGLSMGFKLVNGQLDAHAKQQARIALLMKQTSKVQGDFANTSTGLANTQRILTAKLENLEAEIGMKLIPVIQKAIVWLRDHWPEISAAIQRFWSDVKPILVNLGALTAQVVATIRAHWGTIGPIVMQVAKVFQDMARNIATAIKLVTALLRGDWSQAWKQARTLVLGIITQLKDDLVARLMVFRAVGLGLGRAVKAGISAGIAGVVGLVSDAIGNVRDFLARAAGNAISWGERIGASLVHGIVSGLASLPGRIVSLIKAAVNAVIDRINRALEFNFSVNTHIPGVGKIGVGVNPPDIPHLQTGGMVTRSGLAMVHAGEAVVPSGASVTPLGGPPMVVNLVLDGKVAARALINPLRGEAKILERATGKPAFS